jgi:predicted metal-binding protein
VKELDLREALGRVLELEEAARAMGCEARLLLARDVRVDERVRMQCRVNLCGHYARNLMCPPYVGGLEETRALLEKYTFALLLQMHRQEFPQGVEAAFHALALALGDALVRLEKTAFALGFPMALGLGAGECKLCADCAAETREDCRRPEAARPSMEAMGIHVLDTCARAGLSLEFVPGRLTVTGLLLID